MDRLSIAIRRLGSGSGRRIATVAIFGAAVLAAIFCVTAASAQTDVCTGTYILCDDFNGPKVDTSKWTRGNLKIAGQPVRPQNIALTRVDDNGTMITVVDAKMFGDSHDAAPRQGGVLITKQRYGGGRYEVRMRNLPDRNGCSCIWNYYDSQNEARPPKERVYTEIDIEMPGRMPAPPGWAAWRRTIGLNTWSKTDADADATYILHPSAIDPFDGQFHVFRFDWRDGKDGTRKIDWYIDGALQASTTEHVSDVPAQLWVGVWPAPWPGMAYNFNVRHLYIDWVKISAL